MTVAELIIELQKLPQDATVYGADVPNHSYFSDRNVTIEWLEFGYNQRIKPNSVLLGAG